jgi:hypothetical protein
MQALPQRAETLNERLIRQENGLRWRHRGPSGESEYSEGYHEHLRQPHVAFCALSVVLNPHSYLTRGSATPYNTSASSVLSKTMTAVSTVRPITTG